MDTVPQFLIPFALLMFPPANRKNVIRTQKSRGYCGYVVIFDLTIYSDWEIK